MEAADFTSSMSITSRTTIIIEGEHRKCEEISESLRRRFIENGMPLGELAQFVQGKEEDE